LQLDLKPFLLIRWRAVRPDESPRFIDFDRTLKGASAKIRLNELAREASLTTNA
jgi:hypothetical protein